MPTPLDALAFLIEHGQSGDLGPLSTRSQQVRATVYAVILERFGMHCKFVHLTGWCQEHFVAPELTMHALDVSADFNNPLIVGVDGSIGVENIRMSALQDIIARNAAPAHARLLITHTKTLDADAGPELLLAASEGLSDATRPGQPSLRELVERGVSVWQEHLLRASTPQATSHPASKRL